MINLITQVIIIHLKNKSTSCERSGTNIYFFINPVQLAMLVELVKVILRKLL